MDGRYRPQSGQRYVAGLRFWARRRAHQRADGSRVSAIRPPIVDRVGDARYRPRAVEQRLTKIVAETDRYRITGSLRLPPEGYRSRLSDYLNAAERAFLALTDVEVAPLDGDTPPWQLPFAAVSIGHLVIVAPVGEQPE